MSLSVAGAILPAMETNLVDEAVRRLIWRERAVWLLHRDGRSAWSRNPVEVLRAFDPLEGDGGRVRRTRLVDRAIRSFQLERDVVAWRGIASPWLRSRVGSWLSGIQMHDPAYVSVTTRRDVVEDTLREMPGGILLETTVPAGTHLLPLGAMTPPPRTCPGELLLPRGTVLRVGAVARGAPPVLAVTVLSDG